LWILHKLTLKLLGILTFILKVLSRTPRDNKGDDVSRPSGCRHGVSTDSLTSSVHLHRQRPTSQPQLQVHRDGIHHIRWLPKDIGSWSMRCRLGIMPSVISIFEAFEFVASITAFDYVTFAWTLCSFPILLWWLTLRPSKWVTLRVTFVTGRSSCRLIVSFPTILVTFPTSTPHLHFIWDLLWMP
jgi:hypothetical protein